MKIKKAIQHMDRVMAHTAIIPYKKHSGGIGRASQAGKVYGVPFGRWPEKACKAVKELLINLQANAETKRLDVEKCVINHVVVQRAVQGRRRTYRAHGRISPYLASNCHIEFHCTEKGGEVKKGDKPQARITKKQAARQRLAIGKWMVMVARSTFGRVSNLIWADGETLWAGLIAHDDSLILDRKRTHDGTLCLVQGK